MLTTLSTLKHRIRRALAPSRSSRPAAPPTYYAARYAREEYGTVEQLEAGYLDNAVFEPTRPDLLERLIDAWHAMQAAAQRVPPAYQVGGEWKSIVDDAFRPMTTALDAGDHAALDDLLRNFFRSLGDFFGEPTDLRSQRIKQARREQFRLYASRWIDLYGESELEDVHVPVICNPIGFRMHGALITADSFRHNFCARRMVDLAQGIDHPVVCEVGGGFGGFAYHLLRRPEPAFKYIDYDLPLMCVVTAFYLMNSCPDKTLRLFGESDSWAQPVHDCDIAIVPNFALQSLADRSVDICFNTSSFAEMDVATVEEYIQQFERVCRKFILYEDHSWTANSKYAYYQPMGGFEHWNLSAVAPSPTAFQRLHKIPAPFHSDFFGELFEWLYVRR